MQIFTPYGATESLPVCSIGSDEILGGTRHATDQGEGVCVGRPVEGMRVELIEIQDEPIPCWSGDLLRPDGEAGEIVVRGARRHPVVLRPKRSHRARQDRRPGKWRLLAIGWGIWVDEITKAGSGSSAASRIGCKPLPGTLFTIPVEGVFNAHPAVARTALVGVRPSGKTNPVLDAASEPGKTNPVLCVETKRRITPEEWERLQAELLALGKTNPVSAGIETFLLHPSFPVDIRHNAKIFREKLATWAEGKRT